MAKARTLHFSVTAKDCEWSTMTAGGPGGQHQQRNQTAVRCVHRPSGAVGFSRQHKSQIQNKREAFRLMAESAKFQFWLRIEAARRLGMPSPEEVVDSLMRRENLKIEVRTERGWEEVKDL